MRLMVPTTATSVSIVNGPGTTKLFELMVEKHMMGFSEPTGPVLRFTVEDPIKLEPMEIGVEMIGTWKKVGGHYELDGCLDGQWVLVKYWLQKDEFGYRGSIADMP